MNSVDGEEMNEYVRAGLAQTTMADANGKKPDDASKKQT
jgi:hypothetical protein